MAAQTGYFDTLKSVAGKVFAYLASITLAGTDGKTITVTQNTSLDEAVAMSSKAPKASPSFTVGIGIGGVAAGTGGVAFPATAVAVADANTLDDYDEYTAASAACTGAVTATVVWKLIMIGKLVVLVLPSTLSAGVAVSSFVYGTAIPAKYRPPVNVRIPVPIRDNGDDVAAPGMAIITFSTGVITVYKDMAASANFTVTAWAGIVDSISLSWMI